MVESEVRMARGRKKMDEERIIIRRIILAVTMAVLAGLGEAVEDEEKKEKQGPSCAMMCMFASMLILGVCMCIFRKPICAAAVFQKRKVANRLKGESVEKRGKKDVLSA